MGKSTPTRLDRNGTAYGKWVVEVMERIDLAKADHVGISNGGWIILKLATADTRRIASATLISSAGIVKPDLRVLVRMLPGFFWRDGHKRAYHFAKVMSPPNEP